MKKFDLDHALTRRDFLKMGIICTGLSMIYSVIACWWIIKPWIDEKIKNIKEKFLNRKKHKGE